MMLKNKPFPKFTSIFVILIFIFSCKQLENNEKEYKYLIDRGLKFYSENKLDSAYVIFEKSREFASKTSHENSIVFPILMISEINRLNGDYPSSEKGLTEALIFLTSTEIKKKYSENINNSFGLIYSELYNYSESLKYYSLVLNQSKDPLVKLIVKNNIAYNYIKQKRYINAIQILEKIKFDAILINYPLEKASIIDNLGFSKFQLNDKTAFDDLLFAKKIREKNKDKIGLTASYMHLAEYYIKTNSKLANKYALEAYNCAVNVKNADDKLEALQFLTKTETGENAKNYALQSFILTDSIKMIKQLSKNQFAKIKYDVSKANMETLKQKKFKEIIFISFLALSVFGLILYFYIKKKNKRNIKQSIYNTETRISKKLHDELANDVHNTIAFAETQDLQNFINKEILLENLDTIYRRARNISNENKDIDTSEKYFDKLKAMLASYNSNEINVIVNTASFDTNKVTKENKITIYRVVQELMVNMKKHSGCTIVIVSIKTNKKAIEISYSDNGIGCSNLKNSKNGLQNAENRIVSIKGSITFDTEVNKGFKAKISIPK